MKKTALYEIHQNLGAKMVDYAGTWMPLQYSSILAEHEAVRTHAGLFDVSHMGELMIRGSGARAWLDHLLSCDVCNLQAGQVRYGLLNRDDGMPIDDLLVYALNNGFMLVINAANIESVCTWLRAHPDPHVSWEDASSQTGLIALQGPDSKAILEPLVAQPLPRRFRYLRTKLAGHDVLLSRTGYTGEDGFELYMETHALADLWTFLLNAGRAYAIQPAGLGARDSLRLEAGMPLYGHELGPYDGREAGLDFAIADKEFIGRNALAKQPRRVRIGLRSDARMIARQGDLVCLSGRVVGTVSSGTYSPTLKCPIAMAYVASADAKEAIYEVKGRKTAPFKRVSLPFVKK